MALHAALVHCQIDKILRDSRLVGSTEKEKGKEKEEKEKEEDHAEAKQEVEGLQDGFAFC